MIKRFFLFIFFGLLTLNLCSIVCFSVDVSAECAVVINAQTHEVVYEKNPHKRRSMASTTKIMTALLAVKSGKLNDTVTVRTKALPEGTSIGAKYGYRYKLEDLVYGMLLESGNDAALVTAEYLGGNERGFASMMNSQADEIGMKNTNFVTSSGLDADGHYSTAYDMALLGSYAIKNEKFREICSTEVKTVNLVNPDMCVTFSNHNKLLKSCDGVFGIKTGFTKKSGRCLVSACERNGVTYVIATLNAPDDWQDHSVLYDYAFSKTKTVTYNCNLSESVRVYGGDKSSIQIDSGEIALSYVKKGDFKTQILLPRILYAPLKCGDKLGEIRVLLDGKVVYSTDICAKQGAVQIQSDRKPKSSFIEKIIDLIKN